MKSSTVPMAKLRVLSTRRLTTGSCVVSLAIRNRPAAAAVNALMVMYVLEPIPAVRLPR